LNLPLTAPALSVLVNQLAAANQRLVLLVDEFDSLLHHPVLNSAAFFGGLRAAASLSRGSLAVVLASRLPLKELNARTQAINPTGSPFFNIYAEFTLNAFNDAELSELLGRVTRSADRVASVAGTALGGLKLGARALGLGRKKKRKKRTKQDASAERPRVRRRD